jgi:predicted phage terminase large subunit-like protein
MIEFSAKQRAVAADKAHEDFYFFTRWMHLQRSGTPWLRADHHEVICNALMDVYHGKYHFLLINIPPRYGKTELVKHFVAWTLGRHHHSEYIYSGYSATLAEDSSWATREIVTHPAYREIFPELTINEERNKRSDWRTTEGGIVYAAGAGGTIVGFGAGKKRPGFGGAFIADDPLNPEVANSEAERATTSAWFQRTVATRRNSPHTPLIVIMQRLHEDDPSGFLLAGGLEFKFQHVCLPALREDGTALWPLMHTAEALRGMQHARPYTFAGQYQQSPSPPEGGFFKPDQMQIYRAVPVGTRFLRGWDLAATQGDGAYTAGLKLGVMPDGRWIIADVERLQGSPDRVEAAIVNTAMRDGGSCRVSLPQDPGQAGKAQIAYLTRQLAVAGCAVESSPESGDKVTRAEPFAAQVNVGNVVLLAGEWNDALIGEMRVFPNGKYKDQVDAGSRAFNSLSGGGSWAFTSI